MARPGRRSHVGVVLVIAALALLAIPAIPQTAASSAPVRAGGTAIVGTRSGPTVSPTLPGPSYSGYGVVWDPTDDYWIAVGSGCAGGTACTGAGSAYYTWTSASGTTWTNISAAAGTLPISSRFGAPSPVWDAADGYALLPLCWGWTTGLDTGDSIGTYTFVHGAWSNISSASETASGFGYPRCNLNNAYEATNVSDDWPGVQGTYDPIRAEVYYWPDDGAVTAFHAGKWSQQGVMPYTTCTPYLFSCLPPVAEGGAFVYDPVDRYDVWVGGFNELLSGGGPLCSNLTYGWNGQYFVNLTAGAGSVPCFNVPTASWDLADGYLVVSDGMLADNAAGSCYDCFVLNETWTFAGGRWTNVTGSAQNPVYGLGHSGSNSTNALALGGPSFIGGCANAAYFSATCTPRYRTSYNVSGPYYFWAGHWSGTARVSAPATQSSACGGTQPNYSEPYVLTNTGSNSTGTFDYNASLNLSAIPGLSANASNLEFEYPNGTTIPSWLETNASNVSVDSLIWLRLYPVAAHASATIDVLACSSAVMGVGSPSGEDPLLSASYGADDNGWIVFNTYFNFENITLLSGLTWTSTLPPSGFAGCSYGATSLLQCGPNSIVAYLDTTTVYTAPAALDAYAEFNQSAFGGANDSSANITFGFWAGNYGYRNTGAGAGWCLTAECSHDGKATGATCKAASTCSDTGQYLADNSFATWTVDLLSSNSSGFTASFSKNYSPAGSASNAFSGGPYDFPISLYYTADAYAGTLTAKYYWLRERAIVPSGLELAAPMTASALSASPGGKDIVLSWTLGANVQSNQTVLAGTTCGNWTSRISLGSIVQTSYELTGLDYSTTYCVAIEDWNSTASVTSATLQVTTLGPPMTGDSGLVIVTRTVNSLSAVWTLGKNLTGQAVVVLDSEENIVASVTIGASVSAYVATGLSPGATYNLTVSAHNRTAGIATWVLGSTLPNGTVAPAGCSPICWPSFHWPTVGANWPWVLVGGILLLVAVVVGVSDPRRWWAAVGLGGLAFAMLLLTV